MDFLTEFSTLGSSACFQKLEQYLEAMEAQYAKKVAEWDLRAVLDKCEYLNEWAHRDAIE